MAADSKADDEEEQLQYLAVGAHPGARTKTVIGEAVSGPAMVQIWSAPRATESQATSTSTVLPEMQLGICHSGGLTWDCKWCPAATSTQVTDGNDALPRSAFDVSLNHV